MLPRDERRRLAEIEHQLSHEDPQFARKLTCRRRRRKARARVSLPTGLAVSSAGIALLCLVLGEVTGFVLAAVLSAALILLRAWDVKS